MHTHTHVWRRRSEFGQTCMKYMLISATIPTGRFDAGGIVGFEKISDVSQIVHSASSRQAMQIRQRKEYTLMARRMKRISQKQQKNLVGLGAGAVGATAVVLATHGSWTVPAVGATNTYAKFHDKVGDFINFLGLGNGVLVMTGIIGIGIAALLLRK